MGLKSRTKGKRGELELAGIVAELTGWNVKRRVRQHDGDSDLEGVPGWCVEVKRHATAARADIRGWWEQAVTQAEAERKNPVLFFRRDRDEWRAVWSFKPMGCIAFTAYEWTIEGSVEAWAYVAREMANDKEAA